MTTGALVARKNNKGELAKNTSPAGGPQLAATEDLAAAQQDDAPLFQGADISKQDDYLRDPEDFTDVASAFQKRKRRRTIIITCASVLVLGLALTLATVASQGIDWLNDEPAPIESTQPLNPSTGDTIERSQPFLELYPAAPQAASGELTVNFTPEGVGLTNGQSVAFSAGELVAATTPCVVTNAGELCLAGSVILEAGTSSIFLLKDATHSRFFDAAEEFTTVEVAGAPAAATMVLPLGGRPTTALAVIMPDSSGLLFALPEGSTAQDAQQLAQLLTLS